MRFLLDSQIGGAASPELKDPLRFRTIFFKLCRMSSYSNAAQPSRIQYMLRRVIVALSAAAIMTFTVAHAGAAQITCNTDTIEFGSATSRSSFLPNVITLNNTGVGEVEVAGVHVGCSCTRVDNFDRKIIGGGHGKLQFSLTPELLLYGSHESSVEISFSKPTAEPPIVLKVHYTFVPEVEISSTVLRVDADAANRDANIGVGSAVVRLIDHSDNDLKLLHVTTSNRFLETMISDVHLVKTDQSRVHYIDVYAILAPGWPIGPVHETLTIETNVASVTTVRIPVEGEVRGPVRVVPSTLVLRDLSPGVAYQRKFELEADSEIVIGEIRTSDSTITARATGVENGGRLVKFEVDGSGVPLSRIPELYRNLGQLSYNEVVYVEILKPRHYIQAVRLFGTEELPAGRKGTSGPAAGK